jgi:hypothetical protein
VARLQTLPSSKNKLDSGGSAAGLAAEAYRVCQVNDELRKQLKAVNYQKKKYAVMEDALGEVAQGAATDAFGARGRLGDPGEGLQVPQDLEAAYKRLLSPDRHDWQPNKGAKAWGATPGGFKTAQKAKKEAKKEDIKMTGDVDFASSGTEHDTIVRDAMEIGACKLTTGNVLAGRKHKHSSPPPMAPKKPRSEMTADELALYSLHTTTAFDKKNISLASGPEKTKDDPEAF